MARLRSGIATAGAPSKGFRSHRDRRYSLWGTVVLGSGYRWTVDQMSDEERARIRAANLKTLRDHGTISVETNVAYAVAQKP
jgi:hypothetical protein